MWRLQKEVLISNSKIVLCGICIMFMQYDVPNLVCAIGQFKDAKNNINFDCTKTVVLSMRMLAVVFLPPQKKLRLNLEKFLDFSSLLYGSRSPFFLYCPYRLYQLVCILCVTI